MLWAFEKVYLFSESRISSRVFSVIVSSGSFGTSFFFSCIELIPLIIMNRIRAMIMKFKTAARKLPYFTAPQARLFRSSTPAAVRAGCRISGVTTSVTNDVTMAVKAAPSSCS